MREFFLFVLVLFAVALPAQVQWSPAPSSILEFDSGAYTEYQIEATGTSSPVLHYELTQVFGPLPPGIQFNANGLLYGSSVGFSVTQMQVIAHTSAGPEATVTYGLAADLPKPKSPKSSSSSSGCTTSNGTSWVAVLFLLVLLAGAAVRTRMER